MIVTHPYPSQEGKRNILRELKLRDELLRTLYEKSVKRFSPSIVIQRSYSDEESREAPVDAYTWMYTDPSLRSG
jgi:hypothetical protein